MRKERGSLEDVKMGECGRDKEHSRAHSWEEGRAARNRPGGSLKAQGRALDSSLRF